MLVTIQKVLASNEMSFSASASEMRHPDSKNLLLKAYLGIIGSITPWLVALFLQLESGSLAINQNLQLLIPITDCVCSLRMAHTEEQIAILSPETSSAILASLCWELKSFNSTMLIT